MSRNSQVIDGEHKMRKLTFRLAIAVITFSLGIAVATFWTISHFRRVEKNIKLAEESAPEGWQRIDMAGKATFHIPPGLREIKFDTDALSRTYRNDSLELLFIYDRSVPVCYAQKDENIVPKSRLIKTKVDGKDATLENVDQIPLDSYKDGPVVKGIMICVPEVDSSGYQFEILAKYKNEQDYENVLRVVNSIKFTQSQYKQ
jgi:hypothetical protein